MHKRVIYKYRVTGQGITYLSLPIGAEFLKAQEQTGECLCLWFKINPAQIMSEPRTFLIVGTGHEFSDEELEYLDTSVGEDFVWHVFETKRRA